MKKIEKPSIQFIGNSAIDVTGSCYKIRHNEHEFLLDCGLIQGLDIMSSYKANREFMKKIKAKNVDCVVLSHIHIDHSGLIPYLVKQNKDIKIYVPTGSTKFLKLLWEDSAKIFISDCEKLSKKHHIKASTFYSLDDIENAIHNCIEVDFERPINLFQDTILTYYPAGHIINSAQIYLELKVGATVKTIGYTGDIGGYYPQEYVDDRKPLPFVDILIGECTYSIPSRKNSKKDRPKDIEKILNAIENFKKILIPCFSLQRTQQIIKLLSDLKVDCKIYLDSPLAKKISSVWPEDILSNVTIIESIDESRSLQKASLHGIIISASGFMTGGRVLEHLKTILPDSNNVILFVGYCGDEGLAFDIKEGKKKKVLVDDVQVSNKAKIIELRSFSSHASYYELMQIYQEYRYNKLCLVHSHDKIEFAKTLKEKLAKNGISSKVITINKDDKITI